MLKNEIHTGRFLNDFGLSGWFIAFLISVTALSCTTAPERIIAVSSFINDSTSLFTPNEDAIPNTAEGALILYGKDLIANTAHYLGPRGTVGIFTNGMNCQNCHLNAGQQLYANSYFAVASIYPKINARSGTSETIVRKVNDCMERSLNGKKIDTASKEMQALVAYIKWVGNTVKKSDSKTVGGTQQLAYLERAASPANGNILYQEKCSRCHGQNGEGLFAADSTAYIYPPLWGPHSYNVSAGIFKLSKLAGFIKNNMPFGANYTTPQLTEEQAWDLAAFINSQPRNEKKFKADWPVIAKKPFDYPFAPYSDSFSEKQHKYGPFQAIVASKESGKKK